MKASSKRRLGDIFHELKDNPPKVLASTARKEGSAQANKQRVAIAFSKLRRGQRGR